MKNKTIHLILIALFIVVNSFIYGQKLKSKGFYFPYIAPPTSTTTINKNFVWSVADRRIDDKGNLKCHIATSKSADYDFINKFYSRLLDRIPQFTCKKNSLPTRNKYDIYYLNDRGFFVYKDTITKDTAIGGLIGPFSNIKIEVQPLNIVKKNINRKEKISNVPSAATALSYDFIFTLDRSFVFFESMNKERLRNDDLTRKTTFKYNFPRDYKNKNLIIPPGYLTTGELEQNYLKFRTVFMNQVKELILKQWIKQSLGMIVSNYSESRKAYPPTLFYIKDKKERYTDLTLAFEKMREIEALTEANNKLKNKENWHSPAIQKLAMECEEIWRKRLKEEEKLDAMGNDGNLNEDQFYGITKNWLWAKFILNDHEKVIETIKKLKEIDNKAIQRLYLNQFLAMANDYKLRYDINAKKYGWSE